MFKNDFEKILFGSEDIKKRISELGKKITEDYKNSDLVIIGILKGAYVFTADLVRAINLPLQVDFFAASSYGMNSQSSGVVKIKKDIDLDIEGKDVIIVEDIVDTGLTLNYIKKYMKNHNPKSVNICAFLDKPKAHKIDLDIKYLGFSIENHFVVGYGLDYAEKYRNLPYIAILKKEIYS
jgi:hypoxanthine phosphoribosyltransferase